MTHSIGKAALIAATLAAALPAMPALAVRPLTSYQIDQVLNQHCVRERGRAEEAAARRGEGRLTYTNWARNFLAASMDDTEIGRMLDRIAPALSGGNRDQREIAEFQSCVIYAKDSAG